MERQAPDSPSNPLATRPWYWSMRRELWESRWLYLAPLTVAAVFLAGFVLTSITLPRRMRALLPLDAAKQHASIALPYTAVAFLLMMTAFFVAFFYCLDALHGERRDRSLLFWKSLPVSDRTTVLAKASVALLVLPALTFVIIVIAQALMLSLSTVALLTQPRAVAALWRNVQFFRSAIALFYGLFAIALWHAPIYGWPLMISAWARRMPVLWAILPFLALSAVEKILFGSMHVMAFVGMRIVGGVRQAFLLAPKSSMADPLAALTPGTLFTTPGLWVGLIFAILFLALAVRLRSNAEPI